MMQRVLRFPAKLFRMFTFQDYVQGAREADLFVPLLKSQAEDFKDASWVIDNLELEPLTIAASAQNILDNFEAHPDSQEPQNWQAVFDAMREVHGETHSNDHYARMIEAMLAKLGAVKGGSGE